MKKILFQRFISVLCFVILTTASYAYDFAADGIYYNINEDGNGVSVTYRTTSYNSYSGSVIIPSSVLYYGKQYSVTSIGYRAFYGCSGLTSVSIPESVTSIGEYAFCNCSSLTSVTIPNSVTSIGSSAFSYCSGLTSVTIPNSVTSISDWAFSNCSNLTSINIPESVTSISNWAFRDCSGLTSITIPNSVTSIGDYAFENCSGLTSITIPNSVTSIGADAFYGCSSLTSVTIPNSVTSIGVGAFDGTAWCNNQPDGLVYAGKVAYAYKGTMAEGTEIVIKDGTLGITGSAFRNCSSLTSINIPNSVTSIGSSAFSGCSGLTSITIPNSVTSIGSYAFNICSGLIKAEFASLESLCKIAFGNYTANPLSYAHNLYIDGQEVKNVVIPNSVTSIGNCAFYNCSGLTSITIPNSVTSIGSYAFSGCSGLTSITIPNSVTSIGSSAFYGTGWYNNQPDGLVYAGKVAYKYKGTMPEGTEIVIKDGTLGITESAFSGCSGLTSVTIPNSVTSIGNDAFKNCSGLKEIYCMARQVPTTQNNIFNKSSIASATLYVPGFAVYDYKSTAPWSGFGGYKSILVYDFETDGIYYYINSDETIVSVTFKTGCSGSVLIPASINYNSKEYSVTGIGYQTFYGCSGLTSVTIPKSVTSIGNEAFTDCSLQTIVNYGNNDIQNDSFSDRVYLHTQLYVPEGTVWDYIFNTGWGEFHHIKEFAANADDIRNDAVYMIADRSGRNFPVFDKVTKKLKNVAYTLNLDDNDTGACWQVIEKGRDTYLYNIGAGMYAAYDEDNNLSLSRVPSAIKIDVTDDGTTMNGKPVMLVANKSVLPIRPTVLGDANDSGGVEIGDITSVLTLMATPDATGYNNKAADANGNGEIEIGDITTILTIMAGE